MAAILTLVCVMLRRQLASFLLLAIIGGLGLGFAMTAAMGSRRADSAYDRLRHVTLAPDAFFDGRVSAFDDAAVAQLAAAADVSGIARFTYTPVAPAPLVPGQDAGAFVGLDDDFLTRVYRPLVLKGRLARPDVSDEVVINEAMAKAGNFRVGQQVPLLSGLPPDKPATLGDATIVGVVRGTFDVGANAQVAMMMLNKAFLEVHRDHMQLGPQPGMLVRLADGEPGLPEFERSAALAVGHDVGAAFSASSEAASINRTLAIQTVGLGLLALVGFVATLAAVIEAFSRLLDKSLVNLPVLIAIGFEPSRRMTVGAMLAAPVALVAGFVGVATALIASPLIPTGLARGVDPITGRHIDLGVVLGLALVWLVGLVGIGLVLAWRHKPQRSGPRRRGWTNRLLESFPVRMRLGCEAALTPARGQAGAASRSALIAAVLAVAGIVAVGTFGASLRHVLADPVLQGWNFDATITTSDASVEELQQSLADMAADPAVSAVGWVSIVDLKINGQETEVYAFDPDGGVLHPTMRFGHPPLADDEIVLGADFMSAPNIALGKTVVVAGPGGDESLRVVGSATYSELGNNADLASAASLTLATARRLGAQETSAAALIRLADGYDVSALEKYSKARELVTPFQPARVRNLKQVGRLPWVLVALLVTLGLLAVGHGFWRSIRSRRRDFAVLAAIGLRPHDIRVMAVWQSTCIAFVAVVLGVPIGILIGRSAWTRVANSTGVVNQIVVPAGWLIVGALGALALLDTIGMVAGRSASRREPAAGLRDE